MISTALLEDVGFTKGEIRVYFALLELGSSSIGNIARDSGITAAKVYPILDKLIKKGLATYIIKSDTKYFEAATPERIIEYLDEQKNKLEEKRTALKKILPELLLKKKLKERQTATVYETFDGIKTLYNEILGSLQKTKQDFIGFTLGEEYPAEANIFFKNYDAKRRQLKIKTKLIGMESQRNFLAKNYPKTKYLEIHYIQQTLPSGIIIWRNKVATLIWKEIPTAFVIESKQNAEVYRKFFLELWKTAKI
jgi:sugar-specific transcriptional regulator TrmB